MSKAAEKKYLERRMKTLFKTAYPDVKLGIKNTNFKEPEDEVYATFAIIGGKGVPIAGSGGQTLITRYPGLVQVTFWSPNETGTNTAEEMRDTVKRFFEFHRGRTDTSDVITFKAAEFPEAGKVNGWQPVILRVPFYRDESVPIPAIT